MEPGYEEKTGNGRWQARRWNAQMKCPDGMHRQRYPGVRAEAGDAKWKNAGQAQETNAGRAGPEATGQAMQMQRERRQVVAGARGDGRGDAENAEQRDGRGSWQVQSMGEAARWYDRKSACCGRYEAMGEWSRRCRLVQQEDVGCGRSRAIGEATRGGDAEWCNAEGATQKVQRDGRRSWRVPRQNTGSDGEEAQNGATQNGATRRRQVVAGTGWARRGGMA
jgi:hypothetical protein